MQSFTARMACADGNQCIPIREKTLEFSSTVSSTLSLYLKMAKMTVMLFGRQTRISSRNHALDVDAHCHHLPNTTE